ncbi:DUF881 domain-containing protein [Cellulomonas wangsupingiae]|uniref:DUF881 domain-containing protein n=1 Tax=Cellulomonas wangsupingiae TaxID=2968085 RepID=A0ABY5K3H9_9CELL|nr:DUF881 domain-containing protein [Cellulomonas wangsupingiae]MCC2333267.1 DUF881 domain-containing protein [Cellulomonas wangsupingiae]UUI63471.1 DUF881 domain-containing protein [Cellulomonas wangsupingiae]
MIRRHAEPGPSRAADESMTLINEVYRRPLDPGYQEAADRRAAGAAPRRTVVGVIALLALAIALGNFATVSAVALRRPAPAVLQARELLESEIRERTTHADEVRRSNAALAAEIAELQNEAASTDDPELFAQLQRDAVAAGVVAVVGPGLRVVLTDGEPKEGDTQDDGSSLVLDHDLQTLVNGLWAAGAEAVAVNGERITSTTAIRSAGAAVLVDSTALSSPYTVEAIGDAPTMQTRLARLPAGQSLAQLAQYGIDVQISAQRRLELPGRGQIALRSAQVLDADGTPSTTAGTTGIASGAPGAPAPEAGALGTGSSDVAGSGRHDGEETR